MRKDEQPAFVAGSMAADILAGNIRRKCPGFLLFQAAGSTKPFSGWSNYRAELDKLAPMAACRTTQRHLVCGSGEARFVAKSAAAVLKLEARTDPVK